MNTVFFGSSKYVLPVIEILKNNFNLELVITTEKNPTDPIINYCNKNNIKYVSTLKIDDDLKSKLKASNVKVAIAASFGVIIPQDVLNIFSKGILNIHPSLLPKYRGTTPVQTAILNGDKKTGVSIILLDKNMDHGPILQQKEINILDTDTGETLYIQLFKIGSLMLLKLIPLIFENKITLKVQNHEKASFTKPLIKDSGHIVLNQKYPLTNANKSKYLEIGDWKLKIERSSRALYPWPGVWTRLPLSENEDNDMQTKLIIPKQLRGKIIKFLPENKVQVEGKKPMAIKDFINGYENAKEILEKVGIKN